MAKKISKIQQAQLAVIMKDPVLWAKHFLITNNALTKKMGPWEARDYQEEMMRDTSLKKVYRCGRRCIPGWAKIMDPKTGGIRTADDIIKSKEKFAVPSMDKDYKIVSSDNCEIFPNGEKEVFRVLLKNGNYVDATGNHPLFTATGWKKLEDLKPGDYIATPSKLDFFGNAEITDDEVKLLAYMIGDGNCTSSNMRFSKYEGKQVEEMKEIVTSFGCEMVHYESSTNPYDHNIIKAEHKYNRFYKNGVKAVLEKYGVQGRRADDKVIPDIIYKIPRRQVAIFLSRLYGTDGWAYSRYTGTKYQYEIGYASNSEELIRGIYHLLLRFGIQSSIRQKTEKAWEVAIRGKKNVLLFATEIGIYGKEEALSKVVEAATNTSDVDSFMPFEINEKISEAMKEQNVTKIELVRLWEPVRRLNDRLRLEQYKLQKEKAKQIADYLGLGELSSLIDGKIEWKEIASIESLGTHMTYDVTVPETHNFVVNDVITHNTGKSETMIVEALHKAFTHKLYRVLFVTPYENQVNLIFMRMKELISQSPLVKAQIVTFKSSPYTVEFKNGSKILGFTTGAASGSGAASVK